VDAERSGVAGLDDSHPQRVRGRTARLATADRTGTLRRISETEVLVTDLDGITARNRDGNG
jgi:hypothetical protein